MSFVNQIGTIWGSIPQTAGRIFWVSPGDSYTVGGETYSASDDNDGLAPERALRTVNRAIDAKVTSGAGDVVVLLPGTHTTTALLACDSEDVTITGLPGGAGNPSRQRATLVAGGAYALIAIQAADVEIAYLSLVPTTAQATVGINASGHGFHVHDCYIDMTTPAVNISTIGVATTGAAVRGRIARCYFDSDGAQGNAVALTGSVGALVEDCIFNCSAGTWASALLCGAAVDQAIIRRNTFNCSGTAITVGVNGTGATLAQGVFCHDNRFGSLVTKGIDNFDAAECELSENYDAGVGGGDGGAIITAIT